MTHIILISKDYPNIARQELESLLEISLKPFVDGYFITEDKFDLKLLPRLGLTREIYEVKQTFDTSNEEQVLENMNLDNIKNSYKIDVVSFEGLSKDVKQFADKLHVKLKNPLVDIKNPENTYVFFWTLFEVKLTKSIFSNKDNPHGRRSHLKEFNHPTSIHPKIAKAMINMGAKKSFIDPFCGAGGIVIEGALMGLDVKGSDVDTQMIKRAKANSKAFGLEIDLEEKDALKLRDEVECIVTDLPYGKNSRLTNDLVDLYCDFFTVANGLTDLIIVGAHADTDMDAYLDESNFYVWKQFPIYVHKSMTRTISILKKDDGE